MSQTMVGADQVGLARAIATAAHCGQVDKAGEDYICHPQRVVGYTRLTLGRVLYLSRLVVAESAGWLHDVIEDTSISGEQLVAMGVDSKVVEVVELLTRTPSVSNEDYYRRIAVHRLATAVKHADLIDNTDPWRLAKLPHQDMVRLSQRKYPQAAEAIGVPDPSVEYWRQG